MISLEEKYRADQMASHATARQDGREEGLVMGRNEGREMGREEGLVMGREEGREMGRNEGLVMGRNEGALEIARNMKAEGSETAFIMKVTGLSEEAILAL